MVQPAAVRGLSCAKVRRWEAGLLKNHDHEQEWAAMQVACRGVVWHGRSADLLARTREQVAIGILPTSRAAWAGAHPTA